MSLGGRQCLTHAWYLGADFQLYLTSFFLLVMLYRKPMVGVCMTLAAIFVGMLAAGAVIYVNNTSAYFNYSDTDFE